MLSLILCNL